MVLAYHMLEDVVDRIGYHILCITVVFAVTPPAFFAVTGLVVSVET